MRKPLQHTTERLFQLDGLRGLAIILVVLNHLHISPLLSSLPTWLQFLFSWVPNSGRIGVCILFMLSGFLMAKLYPVVPNLGSFLQKRYTRIFPAFITTSISLSVVRFYWNEWQPLILGGIFVVILLVGGVVWRGLQNLPNRTQVAQWLFRSFVVFQVLIAGWYIFGLSRVPPAVFYQVWTPELRSIITLLINVTMTLPFGRYVQQLDGVTWSVVAEVLFYWLYPMLFLPVVAYFQQTKSRFFSILAIIALFPFLFGLQDIATSVLGMFLLYIHLSVFFVVGVIFGRNEQHPFLKAIHTHVTQWPGLLLVLFGLVIVVSRALFFRTPANDPISNLLTVFPLALVFAVSLSPENGWSRFLSGKVLVTIGKYSYSLYLTHSIVIEFFTRQGIPTSVPDSLRAAGLALAVMPVLAYISYRLLEEPYFARSKNVEIKKKKSSVVHPISFQRHFITAVLGLAILLISFILIGYRVPSSLASVTERVSRNDLPTEIEISTEPIVLPFQATQPNLGMILFHVRPLSEKSQSNEEKVTEQISLVAALFDDQKREISRVEFPLSQIFESRFHPVGLPLQADSLGKNYSLQLALSGKTSLQKIFIENKGVTFRPVYIFSKAELLKNPQLALQIVTQKIIQPLTEPDTLVTLKYCFPLLLVLTGLIATQWKRTQ
jgi:peptidoglycan/LPS O-acetylase OafA/YrhL